MLPDASELRLVPLCLEFLGDCFRDDLRIAIVALVDGLLLS